MNVAVDPIAAIRAITRSVRKLEKDGMPAVAVHASRVYDTDAADLWDALTSPERLRRWFQPVSGDLRLGGRYQFAGNAGGSVTECVPPRTLAVTWEYGPGVSWVVVTLTPDGAGTRLDLEHTAIFDPAWGAFSSGAVGIGWDLGLLGLAQHLADKAAGRSSAARPDFPTSPAGKGAVKASSDGWAEADIVAGTPRDEAMALAENTRKFYTGEASPPGM